MRKSIEDLSLKEIATALECSISTASRKRRNITKLKGIEKMLLEKYIDICEHEDKILDDKIYFKVED